MKTDNTAKAILSAITNLREHLATYTKGIETKIAGLETAYEALTGQSLAKPSKEGPKLRVRKGVKIDRDGAAKTYAFLKERGDKATTAAMVARKFNITKAAAVQRLNLLYKQGTVARVERGHYIDADLLVPREVPAPASPATA